MCFCAYFPKHTCFFCQALPDRYVKQKADSKGWLDIYFIEIRHINRILQFCPCFSFFPPYSFFVIFSWPVGFNACCHSTRCCPVLEAFSKGPCILFTIFQELSSLHPQKLGIAASSNFCACPACKKFQWDNPGSNCASTHLYRCPRKAPEASVQAFQRGCVCHSSSRILLHFTTCSFRGFIKVQYVLYACVKGIAKFGKLQKLKDM